MSGSTVERLLFDGLRVIVARVRRADGTVDIQAREVIVSTGALHSPALLLRSGIGPAAEISALGIDVVVDRPGVGKHLMEHPGVNFGCYMKPETRLPDFRAGDRISVHGKMASTDCAKSKQPQRE